MNITGFYLQGVYYSVHDTVSEHGWEVTTVYVHLHTLCLGTDTGQVRISAGSGS